MVTAAFAQISQSDDWDHMNGWGGAWMWLWGLVMMFFFVVVLVWLVRSSIGPAGSWQASPDPVGRARAILAERYANGDVTTEEYRERTKELR